MDRRCGWSYGRITEGRKRNTEVEVLPAVDLFQESVSFLFVADANTGATSSSAAVMCVVVAQAQNLRARINEKHIFS